MFSKTGLPFYSGLQGGYVHYLRFLHSERELGHDLLVSVVKPQQHFSQTQLYDIWNRWLLCAWSRGCGACVCKTKLVSELFIH